MRAESDRVAMRVRELLGDDRSPGESGVVDDPGSTDLVPPRARRSSGPGPGAAAAAWQRLSARVPLRLDPGRRAAALVGIAVLVVAIATGAWLYADRPQAVAVSSGPGGRAPATVPTGTGGPSAAPLSSPSAALPSGAGSGTAGSISAPASSVAVVDVAGKVHHPGVYRLPAGSRVDDAIRAAGGVLPGTVLNSLNLAARVIDGQQIPVGISAAPAPAAGSGDAAGSGGGGAAPAGTASANAPVNLNTATAGQLQTLPGVGPVLSQHILDWRSAHGAFKSVQDLDDVPGIGTVKSGALHSLVTV